MKKLTALLLCALMLASASCSAAQKPTSDTTAQTTGESVTTEDKYGDALPEGLDYGGYEFRVLTYETGNISDGWACYIEIPEENGTTMNDAAYKRNIEVEERLNVKIRCIERGSFSDVIKNLRSSVLAGEDAYDYAIPYSTDRCESLISDNIVTDIATLPYINPDADYYLQKANDTFTIKGKQYLMFGDFTYPLYSMVYMLFNKDMAESYGISASELYKIADDGAFTIDLLNSYLHGVYSDLDGDGKANIGDRFALTTGTIMPIYLFHSWGGRSVQIDADGTVEYTLYSERNVALLEKLLTLSQNSENYVQTKDQWTSFLSGNAEFCFYGSTLVQLRDIESFDFGLLPPPKYDEAQEKYDGYIAAGLACVPATITDAERTGAIIEALYSASHRYIVDAFIGTYVEQKILRDDESANIYRMLIETGTFDFTRYIDPSDKLGNYAVIQKLLGKGSSDIASEWAKIEDKVKLSFDELFTAD